MPTFNVIEGDGTTGGGGDDGASSRRFKKRHLSKSLWKAIYPRPAVSYEQIRERMSLTEGREVTFFEVNNCMHHVRVHAEQYGWSIAYVEKGILGENRGYFPVVADAEDAPRALGRNNLPKILGGLVTTAKTLSTMGEVESVALDMFASTADITAAEKRKVRAIIAMFTAASEMAKQVLSRVA